MQYARTHVCGMVVAVSLALGGTGVANAQQRADDDAPSGFLVTIAARHCPAFADIRANLARNNLQESLRDLGLDSPYKAGEQILPAIEDQTQPACSPLTGWQFTLGTAIAGAKVIGPWGSLSVVSGPLTPLSVTDGTPVPVITTATSVPDRDGFGRPIAGSSIAGATTIELTNRQARLAEQSSRLWLQGGTTTDPVLAKVPAFAGGYAFGALRCAVDNLNGDNVEWIRFPNNRHVYCYAYYVTPPPTSGTIIIRKRVTEPPKATAVFEFEGNVSYTSNHQFQLAVVNGSVPSQTFYRAATRPGDPPWTFREIGSSGYVLTGIDCTTAKGSTLTTDRANARVQIDTLLAGDTVACTFTNELRPQAGTLLISKVTTGAVGTFPFTVTPLAGGASRTTTAVTTTPGEETDARPGPIALDPGTYAIEEELPDATGGEWRQAAVNCNARPLSRRRGAFNVTITANTGVVCRFTNRFVPDGAITITKTHRGGPGTTGFLVEPLSGPPREYVQSASGREDETVTARGDSTQRLPLGSYVIQETSTVSSENAAWALTSVVCENQLRGFAQGRVTVTLTEANPRVTCHFQDTRLGRLPVPPRPPDPTPTPPSPTPEPGVQPADRPELIVTKRALDRDVRVGGLVDFEVTVRNPGTAPAEQVAIADSPGRGGQIVRGSPSQGRCDNRALLTCRLGTLAPGARATVRVRVRATAAGTLVNTAATGSATLEGRLANNVARASVPVRPAAVDPCVRAALIARVAC